MTTTDLTVPSISCGGCARAIRQILEGKPGINTISVDVPGKIVTVEYEEEATTREAIGATLNQSGYPVAEAASQEKEPAAVTDR